MSLPPTDVNLNLHMWRVQLQMRHWKAANQQGPPDISIYDFGWEINNGLPCPCVDNGPLGPSTLMNVISCRCRAKEKACKEAKCSCHHEKLSCTTYCLCAAVDEWLTLHQEGRKGWWDRYTPRTRQWYLRCRWYARRGVGVVTTGTTSWIILCSKFWFHSFSSFHYRLSSELCTTTGCLVCLLEMYLIKPKKISFCYLYFFYYL